MEPHANNSCSGLNSQALKPLKYDNFKNSKDISFDFYTLICLREVRDIGLVRD